MRQAVIKYSVLLFSLGLSSFALAASNSVVVSIPFGSAESYSTPVKLILFVAAMTFIPSLLICMTSFTRIIIVFSLLRQAMGIPQSPPNQILVGLALFLTVAVMSPTLTQSWNDGVSPYFQNKINEEQALQLTFDPLKEFMLKQVRSADLETVMQISKMSPVTNVKDLPLLTVVPAFILTEIKVAFQIGFMLYIPFVVMDMVVAMVLLSMGMMVLPPVVISLPFKIMLFVIADGWGLVMNSLIHSFA